MGINSCSLTISQATIHSIIYVDDDGTADYTTIQDAINAAHSGDTIYVFNGTYQENIQVDKTLILEGENPASTILDGLEKDTVIRLTADEVTITGFTITNSKNSSNEAGIYLSSNYTIISNNIISENKGYGIYSENTRGHQIISNSITKNYYDGISLISSKDNTILLPP